MFCPKCGATLDENATECSLCGYHIEDGDKGINSGQGRSITCPVCGSALHAEDRVCPLCGATIERQVEEAAPSAESESPPAAESEPSPSPVSKTEPSPDKGGKVETIQEPQPEKQQKREEQEEKEEKERGSRPRRRAWVIVLIIVIVVVVAFLVLYFTGVISFGDRENSRISATESTAVEEGEGSANGEEANVAPNTSFVGYWNIGGSTDEELTISSVTDSTVGFSLWWRDLFRVDNATAFVNEENIATFSCEDSGMKMSGNLTFYEDYIIVRITESNIDYVDAGTMVFNEKHLEAWSEEESANASASSSSSSDSSSTSNQNSGSTSNQNTSTASSGSNTNPSSYYYYGDYVLPNSSSQLLTYADVQGLTSDELRLARNEIYARHGRKFDDNALQAYFNSKPWYSGTIDPDDFSQDMLSSIERSNIAFIESYE